MPFTTAQKHIAGVFRHRQQRLSQALTLVSDNNPVGAAPCRGSTRPSGLLQIVRGCS